VSEIALRSFVRPVVVGLLLASCGTESREPAPFAIVDKLGGYQRRMFLDEESAGAFAGDALPARFVVTMTTAGDGAGAIFVREYRDGVWWSSSPTPGTFVYGEPRIEPGCDDCHRDHAETIGMFTSHAAMESVRRGQTAYIACPQDGTTPCDAATYRAIDWR
jgi:hypothetical protein